jgi:hypothetical protein
MLTGMCYAHPMRTIAAAATLLILAAPALAQQKRTGTAPCRQGALALISMLDGKDDTSAGYKHAFEAVTQTCGPVAKARDITASPRGSCGKLALAVLDAIEDGKINTPVFVRARDSFAASCAPS